ncbi:MAG: DbpA RNA binding domain-containing protein, partial [Ignavibacteriae bacterium]|nr:DbpA RNA binding domain-containing protein [Ignavibacteriota bacterium]
NENMTRFFLNLGKKDQLKPTDVIGLIKDYSGSKELEIGEIDIKENFSFFETESEYTDDLIKNITDVNYKGRKIALEVASARKDSDRGSRDGKKSFRSRKPRREFDRTNPGSSRKRIRRKK